MKKQLIFGLLLGIGLASVFAFKNAAQTRKYATLVSAMDGTMVVQYEDNTGDVIKPGGTKTIQEINIIAAKGYKLVSSHGGDKFHVYVFEKE